MRSKFCAWGNGECHAEGGGVNAQAGHLKAGIWISFGQTPCLELALQKGQTYGWGVGNVVCKAHVVILLCSWSPEFNFGLCNPRTMWRRLEHMGCAWRLKNFTNLFSPEKRGDVIMTFRYVKWQLWEENNKPCLCSCEQNKELQA